MTFIISNTITKIFTYENLKPKKVQQIQASHDLIEQSQECTQAAPLLPFPENTAGLEFEVVHNIHN